MGKTLLERVCCLVVAGALATVCGICRAQDAADALLREAVADRQGQVNPGAKAMELHQAGRHADAIVWFDRALQDDPHNERLFTARLVSRRQAGVLSEDEKRLLAIVVEFLFGMS